MNLFDIESVQAISLWDYMKTTFVGKHFFVDKVTRTKDNTNVDVISGLLSISNSTLIINEMGRVEGVPPGKPCIIKTIKSKQKFKNTDKNIVAKYTFIDHEDNENKFVHYKNKKAKLNVFIKGDEYIFEIHTF